MFQKANREKNTAGMCHRFVYLAGEVPPADVSPSCGPLHTVEVSLRTVEVHEGQQVDVECKVFFLPCDTQALRKHVSAFSAAFCNLTRDQVHITPTDLDTKYLRQRRPETWFVPLKLKLPCKFF